MQKKTVDISIGKILQTIEHIQFISIFDHTHDRRAIRRIVEARVKSLRDVMTWQKHVVYRTTYIENTASEHASHNFLFFFNCRFLTKKYCSQKCSLTYTIINFDGFGYQGHLQT